VIIDNDICDIFPVWYLGHCNSVSLTAANEVAGLIQLHSDE